MWDILHASAFLCDGAQATVQNIVEPLTILLPCKYCRESFHTFYHDKLKRPSVGRAASWVFELHTLVDRKLSRQRVEAFIQKHSLGTDLATALINHERELFAEPSFEVVQKRFIVNRDEPLTWRSLSTVLLALVMGMQKAGSGATPPVESFDQNPTTKAALMQFLRGLRQVVGFSKQPNVGTLTKVLDDVIGLVSSHSTYVIVREYLENIKYGRIVGTVLQDASQASRLLQAGACVRGTCA